MTKNREAARGPVALALVLGEEGFVFISRICRLQHNVHDNKPATTSSLSLISYNYCSIVVLHIDIISILGRLFSSLIVSMQPEHAVRPPSVAQSRPTNSTSRHSSRRTATQRHPSRHSTATATESPKTFKSVLLHR